MNRKSEEMEEVVKGKCVYSDCDSIVPDGGGVTIQRGQVQKVACCGRHAYQYLVETYTTGRQYEEGLDVPDEV